MASSRQSRSKCQKTIRKQGYLNNLNAFLYCTGLLFGAVFLCAQPRDTVRSIGPLFGPVGILSIATQSTTMEGAGDIGYHFGFGAGLHLRVYPHDIIGLQFGATYLQRGATVNATDSNGPFVSSVNSTVSINYICLDAIVNILVARGENNALRLFAGPYIDVFTSGYSEINFSSSLGSFTVKDTATTDDLRSVTSGLAFGAGVDFYTGKGVVAINARYDLGLSDISADNASSDPFYNRGFQLQFSYLFRL